MSTTFANTARLFFVAGFLLFTASHHEALATDCNTDCKRACTHTQWGVTWTDYLCKGRCEAEKALSCRTGLNACSAWEVSQLAGDYNAAARAIELANQQGWLADVHECHSAINLGSQAAGAYGAFSTAWQHGLNAARILKNISIAGLVVAEGVKHFLHCACSKASFRDTAGVTPGNQPPGNGVTNDRYYISLVRADGEWAERRGPRTNRAQLIRDTKAILGNTYYRGKAGYFSSQVQTTTHVLCKESNFFETGRGGDSMAKAFQKATDENLTHCLFRTSNGTANQNVFDRYFVSLANTRNGSWAERQGPRSNRQQLIQEAKNGVNNQFDLKNSGYFSSTRPTRATASCKISRTQTDGLVVEDSILIASEAHAGESLTNVFNRARQERGKSCKFDIRDVGF